MTMMKNAWIFFFLSLSLFPSATKAQESYLRSVLFPSSSSNSSKSSSRHLNENYSYRYYSIYTEAEYLTGKRANSKFWDVHQIEFYDAFDLDADTCAGNKIDTSNAVFYASGSAGANRGPDKAFVARRFWRGTASEEGGVYVDVEFSEDVSVRCIKLRQDRLTAFARWIGVYAATAENMCSENEDDWDEVVSATGTVNDNEFWIGWEDEVCAAL